MNLKPCITLMLTLIFCVILLNMKEIHAMNSDNEINDMIEEIMKETGTPGVAAVTVNNDEVKFYCHGYSNLKLKKPVTNKTLFELGSTTKAFTALSVLLLEEKGLISTDDNVTKYIPWLKTYHNGKEVQITINQLLSHTSGIPPWTITLIPEGISDDMLEKTVKQLVDIKLATYPGNQFSYATINYDVLALVVQEVSDMTFEDYVSQNILYPLGMTQSYLSFNDSKNSSNMSKGYKLFFTQPSEYNAPRYRGNIAAGYLITNIVDLGKWLDAQIGNGDHETDLANIIQKSHELDLKNLASMGNGQYYSNGWSFDSEKANFIGHSGNNPNFSSNVSIDLKNHRGVFVLSNMTGTAADQIGNNIFNIFLNREMNSIHSDYMKLIDFVSSTIIILLTMFFIYQLKSLYKTIQLIKKSNESIDMKYILKNKVNIIIIIIALVFTVLLSIWPLFFNYSYRFLYIWMPTTLTMAIIGAILNCIVFAVYIGFKTILNEMYYDAKTQ